MLKALCAIAFLCASAAVEGQTSWASLGGLKAGQKIQIIEMNSKKHTGGFLSATDSAITFTEGTAEKSIQKTDVRSVKLHSQRRMRNTLIGLGAGAGSGAAIGAAICHDGGGWVTPGECAGVMGILGAAIGTPIGALIPTEDTIYITDSHKSPKP
jgi:hypothetical protein